MDEARAEAWEVMFSVVDELLAKTGVKSKDIGVLVVNCSMFNPTLSAMVVNHYKLCGNVVSYNLNGPELVIIHTLPTLPIIRFVFGLFGLFFSIGGSTLPSTSSGHCFYFGEELLSVRNVKCIVEFAMSRGVRVVPKINLPGRTMSWAGAYPEAVSCAGRLWLPGVDRNKRLVVESGASPISILLNI
ncbi:uncharacterized protein LOC133928123 [Phragmites australis]|uniref:uncharacterized protein LOC133928123 n=1 Tax=Phragmites australis TaxID=29695 RepID=UPI002D76C5F4|nr:uncharacterized protein LOC133928123 [Phragmites australis]